MEIPIFCLTPFQIKALYTSTGLVKEEAAGDPTSPLLINESWIPKYKKKEQEATDDFKRKQIKILTLKEASTKLSQFNNI